MLAVQGDSAFDEPLFITADNKIVEGLDRWMYAQHCGIGELRCKVLSLTPEQTVIWILRNHQPTAGLNAFTRVLIALELEPWLKAHAKANQQHGGEWKQLSKLAEASQIDVREKLARFAGVGAPNVDKVKLVWAKADHSLVDALKAGEVSIHRAWCWVKTSRDGGRALLWERRKARQMQTTLRNQSKKLRRTQSSAIDGLNQMRAGLRQLLQHQGEGAEIGAKVMQMFSGMGDEDHDESFAAAAA